MVDRRRDAQRELKGSGVTCPICGSTRLYRAEFENPKSETPSSDRRRTVRGKPAKPYEFIRVDCGGCGNVLFFDPSTFGPHSNL